MQEWYEGIFSETETNTGKIFISIAIRFQAVT